MNGLRSGPQAVNLGGVKRSDVAAWATRYLTTVVAELVAAGVDADDIERAVELTIVDLHTTHPGPMLEAVDAIRANTAATLAILRDTGE